jgi:DNA mismatch repair protein MutS
LKTALEAMTAAQWRNVTGRLDALEDVTAQIVTTLVEEPPLTLADGGAIATGVDAELDELRTISTTGRQAIAAIEERERQRTGIGSLKVRYNSVFGYYIEITKANLAMAPADYERKQTLVNAERFTTPELKEYERKILTAHDRSIEIEKRILAELRTSVLGAAGRIRRSSAAVAEADRAASGDRAVDGRDARGKVHCQRYLSGRDGCGAEPAADNRTEHGRQEHVSAPGRDAGADGADGQLCSGGELALRVGGPHLYAHRGQ